MRDRKDRQREREGEKGKIGEDRTRGMHTHPQIEREVERGEIEIAVKKQMRDEWEFMGNREREKEREGE